MTSTVGSTPLPEGQVRRFGKATRLVHRGTGVLMLLCVASASCLYLAPLAQLVGRRDLVVTIHVWSGLLLPLPLLAGLVSKWFRADLGLLNRFEPCDREWLRAVRKRLTAPRYRPAGKFNAGQKLYAGWIAGAILVMAGTGVLMWNLGPLPFVSRTSAIFVHDCLAWAIAAVLAGHLRKALRDPEARHGMRTGFVSRGWAERNHSRWRIPETGQNDG